MCGPGRSSKKLALSGIWCATTSEFKLQEENRSGGLSEATVCAELKTPFCSLYRAGSAAALFIRLCFNYLGRTLEFCISKQSFTSTIGQSAGDPHFLTSWTSHWSSLGLEPFPKMTCFVPGEELSVCMGLHCFRKE